jgi:hypothetical protein
MPYLVRAVRCIDNNCSFLMSTSIQEHTTNKELLKVTDLLGREKNKQINFPFTSMMMEQ